MKLVFNRKETAAALGKTPEDFDAALPSLLALGFPRPVKGLGSSWSIMEVIRWINREETPTLQSVVEELEAAEIERNAARRAALGSMELKPSRH